MNPELQRLRALAAVIATAEITLGAACRTLRESAAALLRTGDATLADVSAATELDQGELLELLSRNLPAREPLWRHPVSRGCPRRPYVHLCRQMPQRRTT
ncbi:hypothetical protein R5O87_17765 [Arthrobacter globiformis]|uniref:hypothetical protein n=1 Tax=Arthrobacter globiformis TaxID=1665 RepID=UPI00397CEEF1